MATIPCEGQIIDNINDINKWIQGPIDGNVTLSDGVSIESFRKFAISDLSRTGGALEVRQYYKDDIVTFQRKLYTAIKDNYVEDASYINFNNWMESSPDLAKEGNGISAYLEFDIAEQRIINSSNVVSVSVETGSSAVGGVIGDLVVGDAQAKDFITVNLSPLVVPTDPNKKIGIIFGSNIKNMPYEKVTAEGLNPWPSYASGMPSLERGVYGNVITNKGTSFTLSVLQGFPNYQSTSTSGTSILLNEGQIRQYRPTINLLFFTY